MGSPLLHSANLHARLAACAMVSAFAWCSPALLQAETPEKPSAAKSATANRSPAPKPAAETKVLADASLAVKSDPRGVEFFEKKIRPLLVQHCYQCHSAQSAEAKGKLLLDSRVAVLKGGESGAAVVPGHSEESLLIEALKYDGLEMPPKGQLPPESIALFAEWIDMGAPFPKAAPTKNGIDLAAAKSFWALQVPKRSSPPVVKDSAWPKSDLDRWILAKLEATGLKPVADADRETLLRRVTFDLIGLPPTAGEIIDFQNDKSADAYEKVVDRLLASSHFGERWGRHWLDVARFGESSGKERNVAFFGAWRYRDYVIDALNRDIPYDRFITEQVAGDLLPAKDLEERNRLRVATGFLAIGPKSVNERNRLQYLMDEVDEQIDVTFRSVMALTVNCARCHDHKFDPIPTTDYYALAGIFRSTHTHSGFGTYAKGGAKRELDKAALMKMEAAPLAKAPPAQERERTQLTAKLNELRNTLAETLAAKKGNAKKAKKNNNRKKAAELASSKADGPTPPQIRAQLEQIEARLAQLGAGAPTEDAELVMGVADGKTAIDCEICVRGEVSDLGAKVPRGFLTVLKTNERIPADESGRVQLARYLTNRANPLTARVMVNRAWHHLFGVGLVDTVDNFGLLGDRPSHPELLDQLAISFMDNGWSVKKLIRSIALSRTYRMSSVHDDENYTADPGNELVWRMNRRRLEAEAIRDAVLAASGQMQFAPLEGSVVTSLDGKEIGRRVSVLGLADGLKIRSVYLPSVRNELPEMMAVFDAADSSMVVGQREITTVPTQALFMMNSPFIMQSARSMAERLRDQAPNDADRMTLAYRLLLGRSPTPSESGRGLKYVKEYSPSANANEAWTSLCQILMASAEFRYVY